MNSVSFQVGNSVKNRQRRGNSRSAFPLEASFRYAAVYALRDSVMGNRIRMARGW